MNHFHKVGLFLTGVSVIWISGCIMPRLPDASAPPSVEDSARASDSVEPALTAQSGDTLTDEAEQIQRLLRFVPLTMENRRLVNYGNQAAWFASWEIERLRSLDDLETMSDSDRNLWLSVFHRQTVPPMALGNQFLAVEDQKSLYGYDIFDAQRFLEGGEIPQNIPIVQVDADRVAIDEALLALGYNKKTLDDNAVLYTIRDDFEFSVESETATNRMGERNRILLMDDLLISARATEVITGALAAYHGDTLSLADDPSIMAALRATTHPSLVDYGQLLGITFYGDWVQPDIGSMLLQPGLSMDEIQIAVEARLLQNSSLPPYLLNAFSTRHEPGATYLILATVFLPAVDVETANSTLADRMENYISVVTDSPMSERWNFEARAVFEIDGLPVSVVVMRVDDPSEGRGNILSWIDMIYQRDLEFLVPQE